MKKTKLLVSVLLCAAMLATTACGGSKLPTEPAATPTPVAETKNDPKNDQPAATSTPTPEPVKKVSDLYSAGTTLRLACGYNNAKTGIAFSADIAGEGITLPDGKTYHTGDLKPTWAELEKILGVKLEDKYQGNSATNEFAFWKEKLEQVDMVIGNAGTLTEHGNNGDLVNIGNYLDMMPNFKAYLDANPIVRLSITGSTTGSNKGAVYFAPYFDGVNDIERMPLMRTDWVQKLLDGSGKFTAKSSLNLAKAVYEPYMPTSGKITVDVVKADGKSTEKVTKDYDKAGNIVAAMNKALASGKVSGVDAVNMLRDYIDKAYNGYYGTNRSDLFIGQNAAWDADELVALLRCVVANPQTLNGTDNVEGIFSREDANNQRRVDMYKLAGILFGVRGMESRSDYLYVGADGQLHDARLDEEAYTAIDRMHALAQEGLISESFVNTSAETSSTMLENDLGFMSYDYNQTQTILNKTKLNKNGQSGEKYMAVMVPVARWYDGTDANGVYMRFTESWRSVKTDAWAISVKGIGKDENKLYAALSLIDYAYSEKGQILMSYGPDAFIKTNADGSYVTFSFNGKDMPVISDATYEALWTLASGNYTNFARFYLGSTLSFVKSQAFEYQCTHEVGKEGAAKISAAIALGTIKHPELALTSNPWYTSVPTVLPNTTVETDLLNTYTEITSAASGYFGSGKNQNNLFVNLIAKGYTDDVLSSKATTLKTVTDTWNGKSYLALKQSAWKRITDYYKSDLAK
jgi:putative aldouronate transport system substrate-binding protein